MADRTVRVRLDANVAGFTANMAKAKMSVADLAAATDKLGTTTQRGADAMVKHSARAKQSVDSVAKGLGGIGLVAAAGIGLAVKDFARFDKEMSSVQAATQETGANMTRLRDAALQAGKATMFSATEAATGIENLAKAGVTTADILGGGLKGALDLAAAGQIDVGMAAETAATAMTQFGLSGKDVPHIADLLAAGAGKAQGEVTDMAMALKQGGLVASQFGLSVEESTGTLAAFASAGLIGSDAGTSFKTMLLRLASPAGEAADLMKQLGIHAYDAQGAFIGIAPLAEQLKTKLAGLTQEQRDSALATIFGTDAIRAANVLYNQGAKGIAEWTTKVNDQGFASEQAAAKTNNLIGDVERLGGSLETGLIKGGSGANDVLRALAQGADAAITGFSELPDVVTAGVTAIASVAAVGGLGAAGLLKATSAAGELRAAWSNLGRTGKTLTLSMGGVGLALTAAAVVYGVFAKRNQEAQQRAEDLRATLNEQTGAITGNTRAYVANDLAQSGLAQKAKDLGLNLSQITDASLGNKAALDSVVGTLNQIVAANTTVTNTGRSGVIQTMTDQGRAALDLRQRIQGLDSSLTGAQQTQRLAAEGAKEHSSAQQLAAAAMAKASEKAQVEKKSLDDLIESMHRASNVALTLSGAQIAFQAALDDATASIKDNGRTLDITTEKGRANRTALNGIAKAANDQTDAMLRAGRSNIVVAKTAESARANISKVAQAMGLSKPKADALAKSLIDIPKSTTAKVAVPGATAAKAQVDRLRTSLDRLHDRTVTITAIQQTKGGGGHAAGFATGGILPGAPSAKDNMVIGAASGEFVVNAAQTAKHRSLLEAVNSGVRGFAAGGLVGYAGGGFAPGGKLIDFQTLIRQLAAAFNPLAGIDFAGTLRAQQKAAAELTAAGQGTKVARAGVGRARAAETHAQTSVDAQRKTISAMKTRFALANKLASADETEAQRNARALDQARQLAAANAELERRMKALTKAKANSKIASGGLSKAEDVYRKKLDAARAANDAHRQSIEALIAQQKAAVEFADQISQQLQGGGNIVDLFAQSLTGKGTLADLQQQGADLKRFADQVAQLRKLGLNNTQIQQIIDKGAGAGGDTAQAIIEGGQGLVAALNAAQLELEKQADRIAAGAATAVYGATVPARASGGPVKAGTLYRVNENGVELFRPDVNGVIDPANRRAVDGNRFARGTWSHSSATNFYMNQTFNGLDALTADTIGHRTAAVMRFAGRA